MRRLTGTLMLMLAAGTLLPAASAAATAEPAPRPALQQFGVRLVDVPVPDAGNPRGLRYIIDYLPSGTVIHRRILVLNQESRTAHFTVYPDAARIGRGLFTGDAGATRSELTSWITLQHPALTLGPQASAMDTVTISVPRTATRGEHYGVIWVQQAAPTRTAAGFAINEIARVGIRIYLAVGHGGAPPTTFAITAVTGHKTASGQPSIIADVRNTGGRAIDLTGTARLTSGPGGTSAGPFPVRQALTLAPGQSGDVTFTPGRLLAAGPWHATITLTSGFTTHTASTTILFSSHLTAAWTPAPTMMIWAAALIVALFLLALVTVRHGLQTRRVHA